MIFIGLLFSESKAPVFLAIGVRIRILEFRFAIFSDLGRISVNKKQVVRSDRRTDTSVIIA